MGSGAASLKHRKDRDDGAHSDRQTPHQTQGTRHG